MLLSVTGASVREFNAGGNVVRKILLIVALEVTRRVLRRLLRI